MMIHPEPSDVVGILRDLVAIPSVNPDTYTESDFTFSWISNDGKPQSLRFPVGEKTISEALLELLSAWGADVVWDEVTPGRANVLARFAPLDRRPRILWAPHIDTVGVEGWKSRNPFYLEEIEGRLYGRGASDTKGSAAAMLWVLYKNRTLLKDLPVAIDFVGFIGEETNQCGSLHFAERYAGDYEFAIIGEPTGMDIVFCSKGTTWCEVTAHGRAAHGSCPECGENAILMLSKALLALDAELRPQLAEARHPVLGGATMNIGEIRGGKRVNVVPDIAVAKIDIRTAPQSEVGDGAFGMLQKLLHNHSPHVEATCYKSYPPLELDIGHPWVRFISSLAPDIACVGAPWFSDASSLSPHGLAAVCWGPGHIEQAHTSDEYILRNDLEKAVVLYDLFVRSLQSFDKEKIAGCIL